MRKQCGSKRNRLTCCFLVQAFLGSSICMNAHAEGTGATEPAGGSVWMLMLLGLLAILLVSIIFALRRVAGKRAAQLLKASSELEQQHVELVAANEELVRSNQELEASMDEMQAMEESLQEQYDILEESRLQLKTSEEKNQAIIRAMPDILFIIDQNGTFLDCHGNDEQLLMPKTAFIGKNISDIIPVDIAAKGIEKISAALSTGVLQTYEYAMVVNNERQIFEMRIVRLNENEVVCITRNITTDAFYKEKIEYLSYHDQLTGLYNRRFFEEELRRLDVKRNLPLCVVMGDVNGLKLVNDSFGHAAGDRLLVKVAEILKRACRADEIISRIGGDEFVILIPNIKDKQVDDMIERINTISKDEEVEGIGVSISFGMEVKHHEYEDIHALYKKAEDCMYKKKLFESPSMKNKTLQVIIHSFHESNSIEKEHSIRVSGLSAKLATAMGLPEQEVEEIRTIGLLHDIGKIVIDENILKSKGCLSNDEYEEVKRHPEAGYRILSSVSDMSGIAEYVLYHHEHWDGSGYPKGLKEKDIPVHSRMLSICEAYDVMTSDSSYGQLRSKEAAVQELNRSSGLQFDPELVRIFIDKVLDEGHASM